MSSSKNIIFTRTIWMLSFVSLFNDVGSEMLVPVMPIYLKTIGFSALWIGILEGLAEAIVGLSKGYFGKLSDERGKRLPFVQFGYFLSNACKPLMAAFIYPLWVLLIKTGDKLGKGIRTSARDAMLSDECTRENKGKVFGLHRALDTLGAAIGPSLALVYLFYHPGQYESLFLYAFIPGAIAVSFTFFIKEKKKKEKLTEENISDKDKKFQFLSYFSYWKIAPVDYKNLIIGLLIFALFNSSDVFLLLMAKHIGINDLHIIGVYIFYNLIYAIFAFPIGTLSDKIGMKSTFILGLLLFSIVYGGMAFVKTELMLYLLFFIYGIYAACTDGISKAWISKIATKSETATALGLHASCTSIATMFSSFIAGLLWVSFNPSNMFIISSVGVMIAALYFTFQKSDK